MCVNCGCGDYDDKRGNETNISTSDIKKAAEGEGMSVKDTINEMIDGLNSIAEDVDK